MARAAQVYLLQPISMEDRAHYLKRFEQHPAMREIISSPTERAAKAAEIFAHRWANADVTVKQLNGMVYFID